MKIVVIRFDMAYILTLSLQSPYVFAGSNFAPWFGEACALDDLRNTTLGGMKLGLVLRKWKR